jgi:hypothetical protein
MVPYGKEVDAPERHAPLKRSLAAA